MDKIDLKDFITNRYQKKKIISFAKEFVTWRD
jgi:hypothetical protein